MTNLTRAAEGCELCPVWPGFWISCTWFLVVLLTLSGSAQGAPTQFGGNSAPVTFTNPIVRPGAEPWVAQRGTNYYFCQSGGTFLKVAKAARLQDIGRVPWKKVWIPPSKRQICAPELHYLRGRWYVYLTADENGAGLNFGMYVLAGTSQDPQALFEFRGPMFVPTPRSTHGTVLEMADGRLYFVWSGREWFSHGPQSLYIAPMKDPLTIVGEAVCISRPDQEWESWGALRGERVVEIQRSSQNLPQGVGQWEVRKEHLRPGTNVLSWARCINDAPEVLKHGTNLFVIYSANNSVMSDDYCLGQLKWTGGDVLDPHSWVKKTTPVFSRTAEILAPGHCCFVKSPDGTEDWMLYQYAERGKDGRGTFERQVGMRRFGWNADGSPHFGTPSPLKVPLPAPSERKGKDIVRSTPATL